jgi:hypothetical protein
MTAHVQAATEATVPLRHLWASCDEVAARPSGALLFGATDRPLGIILLERGRICWAVAPGRSRLLPHLLAEGLDVEARARLDRLAAECRRAGVPLGPRLVEDGVVTQERLRAGLLRHTVESLLAIAEVESGPPSWVAHRAGGYHPATTFAPAEVFARAASAAAGVDHAQAQASLEAIAAGDGAAAAFLDATPVAALADDDFALAEVEALRDWAGAVFAAMQTRAAGFVAAQVANGVGCAAWRSGPLLCVARCLSAVALARLIARLSRLGPKG